MTTSKRVLAAVAAALMTITVGVAPASAEEIDLGSISVPVPEVPELAPVPVALPPGSAEYDVPPLPYPLYWDVPREIAPPPPVPQQPAPFVSRPIGTTNMPIPATLCSLPSNSRFENLLVTDNAQCRHAFEAVAQIPVRTQAELGNRIFRVNVFSPKQNRVVTIQCNQGNPNGCPGYPDGQIGFTYKNLR